MPADGAGVSWLHRHTEVIRKAVDVRTGRVAMTVRADAAQGGRGAGEVSTVSRKLTGPTCSSH